MNLKGCFMNNTDNWKTPKEIYKHFMEDLHCIDPCPYLSEEDNLNKIYVDSNIYINPPYSYIERWVDFIIRNLEHNNRIYLLIPARTDTRYFHKLMKLKEKHVEIYLYFIKGRLHFNDEKNSAPFPSVLIEMKEYKTLGGMIKTLFIEQDEIFDYTFDV